MKKETLAYVFANQLTIGPFEENSSGSKFETHALTAKEYQDWLKLFEENLQEIGAEITSNIIPEGDTTYSPYYSGNRL